MVKWEYYTVTVQRKKVQGNWLWVVDWSDRGPEKLGDFLDRHGAQGWELVSTMPSWHEHQFGDSLRVDSFLIFMKRPL